MSTAAIELAVIVVLVLLPGIAGRYVDRRLERFRRESAELDEQRLAELGIEQDRPSS